MLGASSDRSRTEVGALAGRSPRLWHGVGPAGLCVEAASEHIRAVASAEEEVGDSSSVLCTLQGLFLSV